MKKEYLKLLKLFDSQNEFYPSNYDSTMEHNKFNEICVVLKETFQILKIESNELIQDASFHSLIILKEKTANRSYEIRFSNFGNFVTTSDATANIPDQLKSALQQYHYVYIPKLELLSEYDGVGLSWFKGTWYKRFFDWF
jgi:hypothetical protein